MILIGLRCRGSLERATLARAVGRFDGRPPNPQEPARARVALPKETHEASHLHRGCRAPPGARRLAVPPGGACLRGPPLLLGPSEARCELLQPGRDAESPPRRPGGRPRVGAPRSRQVEGGPERLPDRRRGRLPGPRPRGPGPPRGRARLGRGRGHAGRDGHAQSPRCPLGATQRREAGLPPLERRALPGASRNVLEGARLEAEGPAGGRGLQPPQRASPGPGGRTRPRRRGGICGVAGGPPGKHGRPERLLREDCRGDPRGRPAHPDPGRGVRARQRQWADVLSPRSTTQPSSTRSTSTTRGSTPPARRTRVATPTPTGCRPTGTAPR